MPLLKIIRPYPTIFYSLALTLGSLSSCNAQAPPPVNIKLVTTKGDIVLKLYDETPLHRDNFIKIVNNGILDSLLFHRVIENFMVQSGDIDSKNAARGVLLGEGELDYTIPAEPRPTLFHKKGVLAAARDDNPMRESSSTQFYIVQGKVCSDSLLALAEKRINTWLSEYYIKQDPAYATRYKALLEAGEKEDWENYEKLNADFKTEAKTYTGFTPYAIPDDHREVYKTLGGTPHLDQNYTIFGEVVSGLSVVDSIAMVATDKNDRPSIDVRIVSARVMGNE